MNRNPASCHSRAARVATCLRQQLSLEMLESDDSITLDEVLRYKYNTRLLLADRVKPDVIKLARTARLHAMSLVEAADVLERWGNTVSRESRGAMLFVTFWNKYRERAGPVFAVPWDEGRPASTPYGIGDEKSALEALAAAVKDLTEKYGKLQIAWGDLHRLRRGGRSDWRPDGRVRRVSNRRLRAGPGWQIRRARRG